MFTRSQRFRFWRRAQSFVNKKVEKNCSGVAHRCPNCLRWPHQMRSGPMWSNETEYDIDMTCTSCGYTSHWRDMGVLNGWMVPVGPKPAQERIQKLKEYGEWTV